MPKQDIRSLPLSGYPDDAFAAAEAQAVLKTRHNLWRGAERRDEEDACLAWPVACYHVVREYLEVRREALARDLGLLQQQDLAFVSQLLTTVKAWRDQPRSEWTLSRWIAEESYGIDRDHPDADAAQLLVSGNADAGKLYTIEDKQLLEYLEQVGKPTTLNNLKKERSKEKKRRLEILAAWSPHFSAWKRLGERRDLVLPVLLS